MLSSFTIRNYRSILDLRLDFSYGEGKAPNGHEKQDTLAFIGPNKAVRVVPCLALFGANASGKTNLIKAFLTMWSLVQQGGKLADLFNPNRLNPKYDTTSFALEYFVAGDQFRYEITYSAVAITHESLAKNGKEIVGISNLEPEFDPAILTEAYSREKLAEILRVECSDGEGHQTKLFLNRIGSAYPGLNPALKSAFTYFGTGLVLYTNELPFLLPGAVDLLAGAMAGDKAAALKEITDFVRRLDIDIAAIDMIKHDLVPGKVVGPNDVVQFDQQKGTGHWYEITAAHEDTSGAFTLLDFMKHESAGTKRLAGLVGLILFALKSGSVLVIDELECSLHPLLLREIVLLFKKRRLNPRSAQLIFTTHSTDILDDSILRISEIALVRKTLANGTLVRRLVDAKKNGGDIRNVTNFRKQYLAGFYSGVPHPAL